MRATLVKFLLWFIEYEPSALLFFGRRLWLEWIGSRGPEGPGDQTMYAALSSVPDVFGGACWAFFAGPICVRLYTRCPRWRFNWWYKSHPELVFVGRMIWKARPAGIRDALKILWKAVCGYHIAGLVREPLRSDMTKATFYRVRRELLQKAGVDIATIQPREKKPESDQPKWSPPVATKPRRKTRRKKRS